MLCERCQKNNATVHMQQFIGGEKREYHLCEACAVNTDAQISFNNFFQGILDMLLNTTESGDSGSPETALKCPGCNLTYKGFRKTGKLGCNECYSTFKSQLETVLRDIHGSSVHQGKFPQKTGAEMKLRREIEKHKAMLLKAVENEEYEIAADLRDKIKEMERAGV